MLTVTLELIGLVSSVVAIVVLVWGFKDYPGRDSRWVLVSILSLGLFFHLGNVLEWSGLSAALDPIEDFLWVLMPALWAFLFHVCGQEYLARRLRESEERYRGLVELSPESIFVHVDGGILYANPAAARLLGSESPQALVGERLDSFFSPTMTFSGDGPGVPAQDMTLEANSAAHDVEVSTTPLRFLGTDAHQVVVHDITRRKATERDLKTAARVLESMVEGVCLSDASGVILYTNPAQDTMYGCQPGELVGTNVRAIHMVRSDGDDPLERAMETLQEYGSWVGELYNRRADGTAFTTRARITAIDLDGTRCWLCVAEDLSERKRLEEQLLQANKMESVGRLAGGIAHDFNNLLTVVVGFTELALSRATDDSVLRGQLMRVRESADRAGELTRQLLGFARKQTYSPSIVSLHDLVTDAEHMLRRLIGEHIELQTRLEPGLWNVEADRSQLMQVLMNLTVNARDAMPEGGTLVVTTQNRIVSSTPDASPMMPAGDYVRLTVRDNGVGMSEAVKRNVFEPFFTTKRPGEGTGLGLATCYGIVKQNLGFIWVDSVLGQGSSFAIDLPRVTGAVKRPDRRQVSEEMPGGHERVLLVEDEETVRAIGVEVLQKLGYEVLEAGSGEQALELAKSHPDDVELLVTDIVMPGMRGTTLAKELRRSNPNLPVLFISGYTASDDPLSGSLDGRGYLLHKPFTPRALACKVREALG